LAEEEREIGLMGRMGPIGLMRNFQAGRTGGPLLSIASLARRSEGKGNGIAAAMPHQDSRGVANSLLL